MERIDSKYTYIIYYVLGTKLGKKKRSNKGWDIPCITVRSTHSTIFHSGHLIHIHENW